MPARKSASDHKIDGTWDRAAANAPSSVMATATGIPPMPSDLDPIAKGVWELICKTRANWLAVSDGLALRHLCELWSLRSAAFAVLKDAPTDKLARTAFYQYGAEFAKFCGRFGLTPIDRAKLGDVDPDELDPAAEFIR